MKKGFIFDLDGVIVDTAKYHFLAWKELADELGIHFTENENEHLKGVSRVQSLEKILTLGNVTLTEEKKKRLLKSKNEEYLSYVNQMTSKEILQGVHKVLDFLDANKIPYALGSASKNAPLILEKVGLIKRFKAIVDGNRVSKAKPDPEVFLIAASELKIEPENCIVFEDAIAGVQAANSANMTSIGIGNASVLSEADYCFNDFTEIPIKFMQQLIHKKN